MEEKVCVCVGNLKDVRFSSLDQCPANGKILREL